MTADEKINAPTVAIVDVDEEEGLKVEQESAAGSQEEENRNHLRQPSIFSRKHYDLNGDGTLDTVEFHMSKLDKDKLGYIPNDQVYKLMRENMETNNKLFNLKRVIMAMAALIVVLSLSNFATAWAAATLAKDVTVDSSGHLVAAGPGGSEVLSTKQAYKKYQVEATTGNSQSKLQGRNLVTTPDGSLIIPRVDAVDMCNTAKNDILVVLDITDGAEHVLYKPFQPQYLHASRNSACDAAIVHHFEYTPTAPEMKEIWKIDCTCSSPNCIIHHCQGHAQEIACQIEQCLGNNEPPEATPAYRFGDKVTIRSENSGNEFYLENNDSSEVAMATSAASDRTEWTIYKSMEEGVAGVGSHDCIKIGDVLFIKSEAEENEWLAWEDGGSSVVKIDSYDAVEDSWPWMVESEEFAQGSLVDDPNLGNCIEENQIIYLRKLHAGQNNDREYLSIGVGGGTAVETDEDSSFFGTGLRLGMIVV